MSNKNKLIIVIIITLLVLVVILVQVRNFLMQEEIKETPYTTVSEFSELQELITYLDCEYIGEETSTDENFTLDIYLEFKYDLYTDGISNEEFYNRVISLVAERLNYDSFRLIDDSKEILILVLCDYENKTISKVFINGKDNYFGQQESVNALQDYEETPLTGMAIQSQQLANLIQNDWITDNSNLGTPTAEADEYNEYAIYENGNYEIKTVYRRAFNIIFNSTHTAPILNDITTVTPLTDVVSILGEPTFGSIEENLIGYKGSYIYVFFTGNQISVYRNQTDISTDNFVTLLNLFRENEDIKSFVSSLTDTWPDYDLYDYDENYVNLKYTLKGIKIQFNVTENNGVIVHYNYPGYLVEGKRLIDIKNENIELPNWIYFDSIDSVYEYEKERVTHITSHYGGEIEIPEENI